jgi:hypothetical protein
VVAEHLTSCLADIEITPNPNGARKMILLSLQPEERPTRIKPQEGFVYQNTKGNYFLVMSSDDERQGVKGITFNIANGNMMDMHTYAYHCVAKWPLIGRVIDMPSIEVTEISPEEIATFEKYRGII